MLVELTIFDKQRSIPEGKYVICEYVNLSKSLCINLNFTMVNIKGFVFFCSFFIAVENETKHINIHTLYVSIESSINFLLLKPIHVHFYWKCINLRLTIFLLQNIYDTIKPEVLT